MPLFARLQRHVLNAAVEQIGTILPQTATVLYVERPTLFRKHSHPWLIPTSVPKRPMPHSTHNMRLVAYQWQYLEPTLLPDFATPSNSIEVNLWWPSKQTHILIAQLKCDPKHTRHAKLSLIGFELNPEEFVPKPRNVARLFAYL